MSVRKVQLQNFRAVMLDTLSPLETAFACKVKFRAVQKIRVASQNIVRVVGIRQRKNFTHVRRKIFGGQLDEQQAGTRAYPENFYGVELENFTGGKIYVNASQFLEDVARRRSFAQHGNRRRSVPAGVEDFDQNVFADVEVS